jgi:hypothetical protein
MIFEIHMRRQYILADGKQRYFVITNTSSIQNRYFAPNSARAMLLLTSRMTLSWDVPKLRRLMLPYHTTLPSTTAYFWWIPSRQMTPTLCVRSVWIAVCAAPRDFAPEFITKEVKEPRWDRGFHEKTPK